MRYKVLLLVGAAVILAALALPKIDDGTIETARADTNRPAAAKADAPARDAATVTAKTPVAPFREGTRIVTGLGIVEPADGEIDLAFPIVGIISKINVEEGDRVARGTILAELSNEDLKAKLAQAQATLAIKSADYDKTRKGSRPQDIARAESDLRSSESSLELLKLQADRRKKLLKKGSVSQETADSADSALKAGQQSRDSAEQALSLLREGERTETIAAAAATMELARHQMKEAEANLDKSYLKAPADGTVLRRYREAGEAVSTQPAVPIVQVGDLAHLVVRAQIDESDIASLRVGQTARISAPALDGHQVPGRVTRISPRLGAKTVSDGSPTEKRDARVLDVIVTLDPDVKLPISLRVDTFIDLDSLPVGSTEPGPIQLAGWLLRQ